MNDDTDAGFASPAVTGGVFVTTHWTCVLAARGGTPEAKAALGQLCEAYWSPVFRFLRREGRDEDVARELTQEFFARILARDGFAHANPARGRFRSFLLGAVKHFLGDLRDRERAAKRGGGVAAQPLPEERCADTQPGLQMVDPTANVPDTYFDRQWALALIERVFTQLGGELATAGKTGHFITLKPWLVGEIVTLSQAEAAIALGLTEGAVKVAIHRLRKHFRELVRAEIAHTVPDTADVDAELRYLIEVLANR
jgi:RNA polymerase sigma-70 factor (ECF subfamily)